MAENATNDLIYFAELSAAQEENLALIRNWDNLRIGFEGSAIWLKGFTVAQIESTELLSIPCIKRYKALGGKLFPYSSRLPERNLPDILWSQLERGLPIELPKFNFNYFGLNQQIKIQLKPSESEKATYAMIASLAHLGNYIQTAPTVRLQNIQWAILSDEKAILFGTPLLPIPGKAFWRKGDFLVPAGYDFELFALADVLNQKINPKACNWVIWSEGADYVLLEKSLLQTLSISSFRMSMATCTK